MPEIESGMRERIAKFLPRALETAICSYRNFARKGPEKQGAAGFKQHHDACKPALAHIELLLKLTQKLHLPDSKVQGEITEEEMRALIDTARDTVEAFEADQE